MRTLAATFALLTRLELPAAFVVVIVMLGACSVHEGPGPDGGTGNALEVVLGGVSMHRDPASPFLTLRDHADTELIDGAQGGFHVWFQARVSRELQDVTLRKEAHRVSDDRLVFRATGSARFARTDDSGAGFELVDSTGVRAAITYFLCPSPIGIAVVDQEIRFSLALEDGFGQSLGVGEVRLVPRCPLEPVERRNFCASICSG